MKSTLSPLNFLQEVSLQKYNTFGLPSQARFYTTLQHAHQIEALVMTLREKPYVDLPILKLGGGSNLILPSYFDGVVVHNHLQGKRLVQETATHYIVAAGGGENWHEFVQWTLAQNWGGLENLSLIPGSVGASPVQNIGAYGVELKDVFHQCTAIDLRTGEKRVFDGEACEFAYRDSIFKRQNNAHYLITEVQLALPKIWQARLSYGDIQRTLQQQGVAIEQVTAQAVSRAVIVIRQSKLPDPNVIGNVGSFFKNPIITRTQYDSICSTEPQCVAYPQADGMVKLAAGWLIEQCGLKGHQFARVGVHEKQALVLVNLGNAQSADVKEAARYIQSAVLHKYGVSLEVEPQFLV